MTYQWYFESDPLSDGAGVSGSQTPQLTIDPADCSDAGSYSCVVTNGCGSTPSAAATLTVIPSADFDGSGFVDTDDFDAFVMAFEAGDEAADFDGTGFVDTDDFDAFVRAFESGC